VAVLLSRLVGLAKSQEQVPSVHGVLQSFLALAAPNSNKDRAAIVTNIVESEKRRSCKRREAALRARTKGGIKRVRKLEGYGMNKVCQRSSPIND